MVSEQEYINAQKIVDEWLKSQPKDNKYPYKPYDVSAQDYARQRALNEILRLYLKKDEISFDDFDKILERFDLSVFKANNSKGEDVYFIRWTTFLNIFGIKKKRERNIMFLVNQLNDKKVDWHTH